MTQAVKAWINADIITMNEDASHAQTLAVDTEGKIVYVGDFEGLKQHINEQTEVIDAEGKTILPGFIEGHAHPFEYGDQLRSIQVRDVSKEVILHRISEAVKTVPAGQWITAGMGFNNEVWEDPSYPTKEELDAVAPDHPVAVPRMDGHLVWFNSRAFEAAGVTQYTEDPDGGEFFRNPDGTLQGCAVDTAASMVKSCIPAKTVNDLKEDLLAAQEAFLSMGLTSMTDMSSNLMQMQAVKELIEEGRFFLRYYGCVLDFTGKKRIAGNKEVYLSGT